MAAPGVVVLAAAEAVSEVLAAAAEAAAEPEADSRFL